MKKNGWIGLAVVAVIGIVAGVWLLSAGVRGPGNSQPSEHSADTFVDPNLVTETADATELTDGAEENDGAEVLESTDKTIAVVGTYEFIFHRNVTDLGGAHPEVVNSYEVKNLKTGKGVKATELFSEQQLLAAFAAAIHDDGSDPDSSETLQKLKAAKTTTEFTRQLASLGSPSLRYGEACDGEPFTFEPATENFAVVGFNEDTGKVALHFGISGTSHVCDSGFPRLRVELDAPAALKAALVEAASGKKGFLPKPATLKACDTCDPVDFTKVEMVGG